VRGGVQVADEIEAGETMIVPFHAGETLKWRLVSG
jgi:dihydroorotase